MFLKRLLAMLTACLLLPFGALADTGTKFELAFHATPLHEGGAVQSIAELLNVLTLSGQLGGEFFVLDGDYILDAEVMLENSERTRTSFSLTGDEGALCVESSLLGDAVVFLNVPSTMEFAAKMFNHMNLPLNRAALLLPDVTLFALRGMGRLCRDTLAPGTGERVISRESLRTLAESLGTETGGASFYYWLDALAAPSGYDETIYGAIEQLPDWVDTHVPEDGLRVQVENGVERYYLGDTLVAVSAVDQLTIDLPELPGGLRFSLNWRKGGTEASVYLDLTQGSDTLLHAAATVSGLPEALPIMTPFSASINCFGALLGTEFVASVNGTGDGSGAFTANAVLQGRLALDVTGTLTCTDVGTIKRHTAAWMIENGFNLFSMNDVTMSEFASQVFGTMASGALPLIAHLPASTCVAMMDVLDRAGVFQLISGGGSLTGEDGGEDEGWGGDDEDEYVPEDDGQYEEDDWDFSGGSSSDDEMQYEEDDWDF